MNATRPRAGSSARTLVVVLAVVALFVVAALWWTRRDDGPRAIESLSAVAPASVANDRADLASTDALAKTSTLADANARSAAVQVGVRLRGQGRLEGRIVERASAIPVPGVRVELVPVPPAGAAFLGRMLRMFGTQGVLAERVEPIAVAESGAGGVFRFEGVRQGVYFVEARGPYHVPEAAVRARVLPSGGGGPLDVFVNAGGRVVGEVQLPGGMPAPHAKVALVPGPGAVLTRALEGDLRWLERVSDENGRFAIDGVPPGEGYEITAVGDGFAVSHLTGIAVVAQQDTPVVVRTRAGGAIVGRVLSSKDGAEPVPLANAHLGVVPRGLRNLRCIEDVLLQTHAVTAADGSFRIEHAPSGDADVLCVAWEHLPAVGAKVLVVDAEAVDAGSIVIEPGATVRLRVVDAAGAPIAGASVKWNPIDWSKFQFDFSFAPLMLQAVKGVALPTTDADGRFVAGPIAGGPEFSIDVSKLGYADKEAKWKPERDGPEITVVLEKGGAIEGVVMDAVKSEPVTSFTITSSDRIDTEAGAPGASNPFSGGQLVEDPAGRFRVDSVRAGVATLTFSSPGYMPKTVDAIEVAVDGVAKGVIVELEPGGVVRGRVVDGQGVPISGASVAFSNESNGSGARAGMRVQTRDGRNARRARGGGPRGPFGNMDENNPAGMMPPGMLGFAANLGLLGDRVTTTNAKGEFQLQGIDAGKFQLSAFHRAYCGASTADLSMPEQGALEAIEIVLTKGSRIEGVVRDRHGRPLEEEIVVAVSPGSFAGPMRGGGQQGGMFQGQSGAQGRYAIEHVAPGSYFVVATRGDADLSLASIFGTMSFDLVTVPPDETVTFDVVDSSAGACRVHGRITYRGEPVSRAQVSAANFETESLLGIEFKLARVDKDGRYEFAGLAPGDWQVNIDGQGPQVKLDLEVPDAPELEIDLALPEGGIEGTVVDDATNEPLEGCEVSVRALGEQREGGGLLGSFLAREGQRVREWTDAKGRFEFERLGEGEYELVVRSQRGGQNAGRYSPSEPKAVSVAFNRVERGLEVRLLPALKVVGRVVDERQQPVENARVAVRVEGGSFDGIQSARSDATGRFEVAGLAPGTYIANASADGFAPSKKDGIVLARGASTQSDVEIAMQRGVKVVVRVFDAKGQPAAGARAELSSLEGKKEQDPAQVERMFASLFGGEGAADAEGRIELGRFAPGKYKLEAERGLSKAVDPKVELEAGDQEVELRIDLR